jgi:hypothetical protein
MKKLSIHLGEISKHNAKNQNKGANNLYSFLVFKLLQLSIKNNYLMVNPNYERIPFLLEVYFTFEQTEYVFFCRWKKQSGHCKWCQTM